MTDKDFAPSRNTLLEMYKVAALLKANDDMSRKMLMSGKIIMPYYPYRGQEIIPTAVSACLTDQDTVCTIYRGIHDMLAKGLPLPDLWAELAGRVGGTCKGKGGPMHLTYPEKGLMVTTGIVGSSMPIANGLAWASVLDKTQDVAVAYFGDGASNIGAFHESLNLASVWKLPVIFVCQNNQYAEHTTFENGTSARQIADRAIAYDMPGVRVDGNDPIAMYKAANEAVQRAREGQGPTLIEAMTFRFHGHIFGEAQGYMDKEKLQAAMDADPVVALRQMIVDHDIASEGALQALESDIDAQIDAAVEAALNSPFPGEAELRRDVFEQEIPA